MKIKGINPLEQHAEKIVLGVVAAIFLGVIAAQFLVSPNEVPVSPTESVEPAGIYGVLEGRANRLKGQIEDPDPVLPEVRAVDLLEVYQENAARPSAPVPAIAAWPGRDAGIAGMADDLEVVAGSGAISPIGVPALGDPVAFAQWVSIDPFAAESNPRLRAAVPREQPFDLAGVSVQGSFDGKAMYSGLSQPSDGSRPVPRRLWQRGAVTILGVELERQQMDGEGGWGPGVAVEPFTTTPGPLEGMAGDPEPEVLTATARAVSQALGAVINPPYPATVSGDPWLPPAESLARLDRLGHQSRAARIEAQIARLQGEIDDLTSGRSRTGTRPTPGRDPGGRGPGSTGRDPAPTTTSRDPAERQVEARRAQIQRLQEELGALGFEAEGGASTGRTAGGAGTAGSSDQGALLGLFESESVPVWAHDLGVEPGATYRYRMRTIVNNPLYGQQSLLDPDDPSQLALAEEPLLRSEWSAWSEGVQVPRETYFFVRGATEQDALGAGARATGEVFRMYYGFYRRAPVTLELGDVVRAEAALPGTLAVFDTARADAAAADQAIAQIRQWSETSGEQRQALTWPLGVAPAPRALPVALDVALIDVVQSLEGVGAGDLGRSSRAAVQAVFRDLGGSLLIRSAGDDGGEDYARVSASADRGEVALLERRVPQVGPGLGAAPGAVPVDPSRGDPYQDPRGGGGRSPARDP